MDIIKFKFSVIALSETWLKKDEGHMYALSDYRLLCLNRDNKKGGGVALFIHNDLSYIQFYKALWANVNSNIKHKEHIAPLLKCYGSIAVSDVDKAQIQNGFFLQFLSKTTQANQQILIYL